MLARSRFVLWTAFVVSLVTAFWQYFEFAYTLAENGLITSPIWGSILDPPWVHVREIIARQMLLMVLRKDTEEEGFLDH